MTQDGVDLSKWKQGDFFFDEKAIPILQTFEEVTDIETQGFAVVSQTCDIVRDYGDRPFVQLAALVLAESEAQIDRIRKFQQPRFGYVPQLKKHSLVVDFDLVVTVDKMVLLDVTQFEGCPTTKDQSDFSFAAGRYRSRFAFPDSVSIGLERFRAWVAKKGRKNGEDGQFLSAISEIRISVDDFDNPVDALFLCILDPSLDDKTRTTWADKMIPKMQNMVTDWSDTATFLIAKPSEITLQDYLYSQLLDFDALTRQKA